MGFRITGKIEGLDKVLAKLNSLARQSTRSKILRKAVNAASRPMLAEAKTTVPVGDGWLKRSLGLRIQTYRNTGAVVAVVGPRTGFQRNKRTGQKTLTAYGSKLRARTVSRPTYYAHLVEFGTQPHSVSRGGKRKRPLQGARLHPGAKARPFLRPAFEAQKTAAMETLRSVILAGIEAELK